MSRLLDLLYPPVCPGCGELPTGGGPLCARCRIGLEGLRSDGSFEELLRVRMPDFGLVVTPFEYAGPVRAMLLRVKHDGDRRAASCLAGELAQVLAESGVEADAVTAIPMSAEKRRIRGFNQAEVLGRYVAKGLGCSFEPGLLRHRGGVTFQHTLSREQRAAHAAETILFGSGRAAGRRIVVVDDICTTGASLLAAVRVLREAGAAEVVAAAVAYTGA